MSDFILFIHPINIINSLPLYLLWMIFSYKTFHIKTKIVFSRVLKNYMGAIRILILCVLHKITSYQALVIQLQLNANSLWQVF